MSNEHILESVTQKLLKEIQNYGLESIPCSINSPDSFKGKISEIISYQETTLSVHIILERGVVPGNINLSIQCSVPIAPKMSDLLPSICAYSHQINSRISPLFFLIDMPGDSLVIRQSYISTPDHPIALDRQLDATQLLAPLVKQMLNAMVSR